MGLGAPRFPPHPPNPSFEGPGIANESLRVPAEVGGPNHGPGTSNDGLIRLGYFGYIQLALLFLMFFLYVGFRVYYARKHGEWDTDEEQD